MTVHPLTQRLFSSAGVRLARFSAERAESVRDHRHESAHAFFLLSGEMAQRASRGEVELAAGGARLSGADAVHDIDFGDRGGDCMVLHFSDCRVRGSVFSSDACVTALARRVAGWSMSAAHAPLALLAAKEAASVLSAGPTTTPDWLSEAHLRIASASPCTPIEATARAVGVSREHLMRQYYRRYGIAPAQARRLLQLARAATLMGDHGSLAEVAAEAGFFDQSHMNHAFRAGFGCTPAAFRQAMT